MLIKMRMTIYTADVKGAVNQTVEMFGESLANECKYEAPFERMGELSFCFSINHPFLSPQGKNRASYSRKKYIFFTESGLNYKAWVGERWSDRVTEVLRATQMALGAVHKTRITADERDKLLRLISVNASKLIARPPDHLLSLLPIYVREDEREQLQFVGFQGPGSHLPAMLGGPLRVLQPAEVPEYAARRADVAQAAPTLKLKS